MDLESLSWMATFASAVVIVIAIVSARNYDHRAREYAQEKSRSESIEHFRYIYRYLAQSGRFLPRLRELRS
jgi:hypothetical protein